MPFVDIIAACEKGDLDQLRKWKRQGVDLFFSGRLLCIAVLYGSLDVLRCVVQELGADVNVADEANFTAFFAAAQQGKLAALRCLVDEFGADINQTWRDGASALHPAANSGHLDVVRYLVKELGADINQAGTTGVTPLISASMGKQADVVRWLVKEGADPQASLLLEGNLVTAADFSREMDASPEQTAYLEAKMHCSNPDCGGAGQHKCQGCFQARYCGQACQLAHWKAHKADCKRWSAELAAGAGSEKK